MINQMSQSQLMATQSNPDLRKKLRADRIRKMTMGTTNTRPVDDQAQPDWMKYQNLREIELIR